ncbi:MAG: hypothetical protein QM673_06480 [Gordonia sp. (in: high G+C Gram-positive bacteria)]
MKFFTVDLDNQPVPDEQIDSPKSVDSDLERHRDTQRPQPQPRDTLRPRLCSGIEAIQPRRIRTMSPAASARRTSAWV